MALPIKDFIIQQLLEFDPNFDVGAGVPTTSLLIDPLSVILQPIVDELTVVQASQSILSILESSDPDAFPEDIVDGLASNAFVTRNPGSIGSDVMRIRCFEPQDFNYAQGVLIFRGSSGQRYTNSEGVAVTSAQMSLNQDGSLYFTDVPIVALEEGSTFNVAAGGITSMEAEPVGVANVTNLFGVVAGADRETNTELIDRIKVAVTVRALVTGRGIVVTLTENFPSIEEIFPVGFHDPEMMRDIVYNTHIGGNADVYIKAPKFVAGSKDIFGLEIDLTRRVRSSSTVVTLTVGDGYSIGNAPIDRTGMTPLVRTIDGVFTYAEGPTSDYTLNDELGKLTRVATTSQIFHYASSGADAPSNKRLHKVGGFVDVRQDMLLTISLPGSLAGTYTIKQWINNDEIEIYGTFPWTVAVSGVSYQVDDVLTVQYEYNPTTVDIIATPRSTDRTDFTITDVPVMYIESIQVLDPLSGEPTGAVIASAGGFGSGGFGMGGFGVGQGANYRLLVEEPTLRHSQREDVYLEFAPAFLGYSIRINYQYASAIPPIQAFMDDRNNQSTTASLLARHFIPVFVDTRTPVVYDIPASTSTTALTADAMGELVKTAITDIDQGADLELSDLIDVLYNNGASRVSLDTLAQLRGEIHNHDGTVEFRSSNSTGSMSIPSDPIPDPTDKPLSPRIARFLARNVTLQRNVV